MSIVFAFVVMAQIAEPAPMPFLLPYILTDINLTQNTFPMWKMLWLHGAN